MTNALGHSRKIGSQAFGDSVDEILLFGITADIGERENHNRKSGRAGFFRNSRRLRLDFMADFEGVDADRLSNILQLGCPQVGDLEIDPPLYLPVGLLGKTDRARLGDAF